LLYDTRSKCLCPNGIQTNLSCRIAMLAATSPGSKEMLEDARRMGYANPPARADLELSNLRGEFLASERESERDREW